MNTIIQQDHVEKAFDCAEKLAFSFATGKRHREIFQIAFRNARAKGNGVRVFCHFPLLIYGLFQDDIEGAVPLAGVTTLFFMGIDLFDDVADGDLPKEIWEEIGDEEVNLAAATFFFSLPVIALKNLDITGITKAKMQEILAEGFLAMASGQHTDLFCAGKENADLDEIENSVLLKSGYELATFAQLAALYANASGEQVERCASLGKAYGTALQLASDVVDIFTTPWSRDLANGSRTLPIVLYMNLLDEAGREDFVKILHQARTERGAQEAVRERLIKAGVLKKMAFITEMYCGEAFMHLDMLSANKLSADELRTQISESSFFHRVKE